MTVLGEKFVAYAAFDSAADANRAATVLAEVGTQKAERAACGEVAEVMHA